MNKKFLKILPYIFAFCFGLLIFLISLKLKEDWKSLFINIASAFIAIPLLYFIYELSQQASRKRLNKEIFDYAKMNIYRELLCISHQINKLIFTYEKQNKTFEGIKLLLNLSKDDIRNEFENNKYIGFQVLKNWYTIEDKIQKLINSSFILEKLNDDQIISLINILKNVRTIQDTYSNIDNLFIPTEDCIQGFTVQSGLKMNLDNSEYSDRYLLLKDLNNSQNIVYDFGDFEKFKISKLLFFYSLNPLYVKSFSNIIYDTLESINYWLDETGSEFLIDSRMYKFKQNS